MSSFIPKEKLSAYERWEVAAFDEVDQAESDAGITVEPTEATSETVSSPIVLPTAEELERIHIEAHDTGYAAGYEAGLAAGQEAGHKAGYESGLTEAQALATQIGKLGENLRQQLQDVDQEFAEQLLAVAIETARQVLHHSLRVKPELLLSVIREAIAALPLHQGHPTLFLNPADSAMVHQHMSEQLSHNGWRMLEDAKLTPGGCRVELGNSEIDATLETRWRRVLDTIGTQSDWLEDKP